MIHYLILTGLVSVMKILLTLQFFFALYGAIDLTIPYVKLKTGFLSSMVFKNFEILL
jgi:hypothetical protein